LPTPHSLYTSTLCVQGELIKLCHAELALSENTNTKRSKRSSKRKAVIRDAKRKSPLGLLISSERKQERRRKGLQLNGNDREKLIRANGETLQNQLNSMGTILLILVILLLIGALPTWPYSGGWGYYPSGGLGLVVVVVLVLLLLGRL